MTKGKSFGRIEGKQPLSFPISLFSDDGASAFAERDLPTEIHIVPFGKWDHPVYGQFEVTHETVQEFIKNFSYGIRAEHRLPITAGHDTFQETGAVAWFSELYEGANGLYAKVEWTPEGNRLLREGAFKYFSPEWYTDYTDPADGIKYGHVLIGGALTNKPFFRELDPVAAFSELAISKQFNHSDSTMNLNDLLAKNPADLSDAEKAFIKEHATEVPDDKKEGLKDVLGEGEGAGEDAGAAGADDGAGDDAGDDAGTGDGAAPNQASTVTISASELAILRQKANQGAAAFSEMRKLKLSEAANKLTFSKTNSAGRFLPKDKSFVLTFMEGLNDQQLEAFSALVAKIPTASVFSEEGTGEDGAQTTAADEVNAKVAALQEKDKTLSFSDALRKVASENPELMNRYHEEADAS